MSYNKKEQAAALGREGERKVAEYLRQKGYIIVKTNFRDRFGEIDIIAENNNELVFVEVKTRTENSLVSGLEAVDTHKQQRLYKTAMSFLQRINGEYEPRFDVAEVTVVHKEDGKLSWRLKYIKNAF